MEIIQATSFFYCVCLNRVKLCTRARPPTGLPRCKAERYNNHLNFKGTCIITHPLWLFSSHFFSCELPPWAYGFHCIAFEWWKVLSCSQWMNEWMNELEKSHRNEHYIDKSMRHTRYDGVGMCIMYNNIEQLQTFFFCNWWFCTMFGITLLVVHHIKLLKYVFVPFTYMLQGFKTLLACRERERKACL